MNTTITDVIFDRLKEILTEKGVAPTAVRPDAHLIRDLGLDSLDTVDLMMELEQEFKIRITDEQMNQTRTVGQVAELVLRHRADC